MLDSATSTLRRSTATSFLGLAGYPAPFVLAVTVLLGMTAASPVAAGTDLTLRINDVKAAPGSLVAVEVRTYAPRGVGQGQICLRAGSTLSASGTGSVSEGAQDSRRASGSPLLARGRGSSARELTGAGGPATGSYLGARARADRSANPTGQVDRPLMTLEGVVVLSAQGDAISGSVFDAGMQITLVEFLSESATINNADGPMVVLYYRLDQDLQDGQEFELRLDPENTFVLDPFGNPLSLELKPGLLRIDSPKDSCSY